MIHAFLKRRNPTCRSKALNNDIARVTRKANSVLKYTKNILHAKRIQKYVKIH